MNKDRAILAVPHTGTRTMQSVLQCRFRHTYRDDRHVALYLEGSVVVAPLRDPTEVWKSWTRRIGTDEGSLLALHDESWKRLAELDQVYDIIYVPLDHPERDAQFSVVQERLGEEISPTWEKVGHLPRRAQEFEKDLSWIYDLPMVKRFYEVH